jgi:hypothetical protein
MENTLRYFISEKSSILVVSLVGPLTRQNISVLEACWAEIPRRTFQYAVLLLQEVSGSIERPVFPHLIRLQKTLRERPAEIRVSGLSAQQLAFLIEQGVLRSSEATVSIQEALGSLIGPRGTAA